MIVSTASVGRIPASSRLEGGQASATLFKVPHKSMHPASICLEAQDFMPPTSKGNWFDIEQFLQEAPDASQAHSAVETGILRIANVMQPNVIGRPRGHGWQEQEAIASNAGDVFSSLLNGFHVCMLKASVDCILANILRDLTACTVLIAALIKSPTTQSSPATSISK